MNRSLADRTKPSLCESFVWSWRCRERTLRAHSVGAHGREAFRSRSDAELISKLEVAIQELDETMYWIELLIDAEIVSATCLAALTDEANELMSILVASVRTIKRRRRR